MGNNCIKVSTVSAESVQASKGVHSGTVVTTCPWELFSSRQPQEHYCAKGQQYFIPVKSENKCCLSEGGDIVEFSLHSEFPLGNSVISTLAVLDT